MAVNRAIFIDKDGTLIPDIPYNVDPELITLSPGAGETLRRLQDLGYLLVVVSNQAGVARGLFTEAALIPVRERLEALLQPYGVRLDGFYYCPHSPHATMLAYKRECTCRKPQPGLLLQAAHDLRIDLARSWMIGDITADSEAGNRAGCQTILMEKPDDPILYLDEQNQPGWIVSTWWEAGTLVERAEDEYPGNSRAVHRDEDPRDRRSDARRVPERHGGSD